MILSTSLALRSASKLSQFHFVQKQFVFIIVGLVIILFISKYSYRCITRSTIIIYPLLLITLIATMFNPAINNTHRWIQIGNYIIQPSELMKPFFAIINALILQNFNSNDGNYKYKLGYILVLVCPTIVLIILEPDIGTSFIYISCLIIQIFIANASYAILRYLALLAGVLFILAYITFSHVRKRILEFFDQNQGYQVTQSIQAIKNGGWIGQGAGAGVIKHNLPEAHCDYIFAATIEEFGIIFGLIILTVYSYLVIRWLILLSKEIDESKRIAGIGIVFMFMIQVFMHIGVNINVLPSTGVTLPFISYGGSSMISASITVGILLVITKKTYQYKSKYDEIVLRLS